jgi:hypothetical protein
MRVCVLVDDIDCEGETNVECFACGQPVCKTCTRMVEWSAFGIKRICKECIREDQKNVPLFLHEEVNV